MILSRDLRHHERTPFSSIFVSIFLCWSQPILQSDAEASDEFEEICPLCCDVCSWGWAWRCWRVGRCSVPADGGVDAHCGVLTNPCSHGCLPRLAQVRNRLGRKPTRAVSTTATARRLAMPVWRRSIEGSPVTGVSWTAITTASLVSRKKRLTVE